MTDNVRKVFDLLGVEPNEKFIIEGLYGTFYFDQHLNINNEYDYPAGFGLQLFINGLYKIIKLPKEPKKKKLRDLTLEEWDKWRRKNCGNCNKCAFNKVNCNISYEKRSWVNNKDIYSDKFLDQEIEVEDDK